MGHITWLSVTICHDLSRSVTICHESVTNRVTGSMATSCFFSSMAYGRRGGLDEPFGLSPAAPDFSATGFGPPGGAARKTSRPRNKRSRLRTRRLGFSSRRRAAAHADDGDARRKSVVCAQHVGVRACAPERPFFVFRHGERARLVQRWAPPSPTPRSPLSGRPCHAPRSYRQGRCCARQRIKKPSPMGS